MSREVAVLHDRFPQVGGGERVAVEAARALDAPVYTTYVTPAARAELPDDVEVIPFRQGKYTGVVGSRLFAWRNEGLNPLEVLAVALDLTDAADALADYDRLLLSGPLSKGYVPSVGQEIYHYPHSPPRWLFDLYRERLAAFDYPVVGGLLRLYAELWRAFDKTRGTSVDHYVANSELVRDRIERFYGREASVVYPPVVGEWFAGDDEGYFVTWSRLAPEKRVPLICEAFAGLDEQLVVAGDGEQRPTVERFARENDNIDYRGHVDDIESLVGHSRAVVYAPRAEDFGLVGAEAQVAGRPLLGVNEGYTRTQVETGHGETFEPTVDAIRATVRAFDPAAYDHAEIQADARRYERDEFQRRLRAIVLGDADDGDDADESSADDEGEGSPTDTTVA